jgi:tetratricopeptide (TPR) repeat protein
VILGWVAWQVCAEHELRVSATARAEAYLERAEAMASAGRHNSARAAYDLVSRLGTSQQIHRAWLATRVLDAESVIKDRNHPKPATIPTVEVLADLLEGEGVSHQTRSRLLRMVVLRSRGLAAEANTIAGAFSASELKDVWVQWQLGLLHLHLSKADEALKALKIVVSQKPEFAAGHHALALAHSKLGESDKAVAALEKSLEHGAGGEVHLDLGRLHLGQKNWKKALDHLSRSLVSPRAGSAETVRMVAAAQYHLKQYEAAAQNYVRAYELEADPRTLLSAAIALHANSNFIGSVKVLKPLLRDEQKVPEVHFQMALALMGLKEVDAAKASLTRYVRLATGRKSEANRLKQAMALLGAKKGLTAPQAAPPASVGTPPGTGKSAKPQ